MENINYAPHPLFLELLFAFKSQVSTVFKDVLGLHEIHHIALTHINPNRQLLTFSSSPAIEFNLFSSTLWRYDKSYNPLWFTLGLQDFWQNLYEPERYDELYYVKQIKHAFPIGLSAAAKIDGEYVIYSMASKNSCPYTQALFSAQLEDFYKIGQYCSQRLKPLLNQCEEWASQHLPMQGSYETSK